MPWPLPFQWLTTFSAKIVRKKNLENKNTLGLQISWFIFFVSLIGFILSNDFLYICVNLQNLDEFD